MQMTLSLVPAAARRAVARASVEDLLAQLLPPGTDRVAAIYTDPANPSYDEVIAQNRKALGPELVVNGNFSDGLTGWASSAGGWSAADGRAVLTGSGSAQPLTRVGLFTPGKTYLVSFEVSASGSTIGFQNAAGSLVASAASGVVVMPWMADTADLGFKRNTGAVNGWVDNVSVREIADWSQIVMTDDPNGTVPIFSVLQTARGRGWLMDRSFGMARGPELVVNGTFDVNTAGWSGQAATLSQVAGALSVEAFSGAGGAYQDVPTVAERWYEITANSLSDVSASLKVYAGGAFTELLYDGPAAATARQIRAIFKATSASSRVYLRNTGTSTVLYDDISVRDLPGNHLSQPTAPARGEFSAQLNVLLSSQCSAGWSSIGSGAKTDITANLLGGKITGGARIASNGADWHRLENLSTVTLTAGVSYRVRFFMAPGTSGKYRCALRHSSSAEVSVVGVFAGSIQTSGTTAAGTVEGLVRDQLEDGLWTLYFDFVPAAEGSHSFSIGPASLTAGEDVIAYAGDLRLTADALPQLPPYQPVTSPADYDDLGYPVYHRSQIDDWAKTRINPNGATKSLVLWAGQKMSNSVVAVIFEHSNSSSTNPGALGFFGPGANATSRYLWRSSGTSAVTATLNGFPAPNRHSFAGVSSILDDSVASFINGVADAVGSADQGSGTYLEHDTYFGARGGVTLFSNTREFAPMTVIFMQPTDPGLPTWLVDRLKVGYARAAGVTLP